MDSGRSVNISIVVPIYNEEPNVKELIERIYEIGDELNGSFECICVDDGSLDGSGEKIQDLTDQFSNLRIIKLRRNFGQTAALSAGIDHARGKVVVTLDADLQNDPKDIPKLVKLLDEGYDLVTGWRKNRKDSLIRNIPSFLANALISKVTGVQIHDSGCTLKAYRKSVLEGLKLYGEMHRFIPALASWRGIRIKEVPVEHHPRKYGKSKYGLSRTFRVMLDLVTVKFLLSYSSSPIQMFGKIGLWSSFVGFGLFFLAIFLKFTQERTLTGNPMFAFFIFFQIISIQFILIGLLAEMSMRIYHETQHKMTYVIREEEDSLS